MTALDLGSDVDLPRWDVSDLYESLESRELVAALEGARADVDRAVAAFDRHDIRAVTPREPTEDDGRAADEAIAALNEVGALVDLIASYVYASVSTDSRDERAQARFAEVLALEARLTPLLARLADWASALHDEGDGRPPLSALSAAAAEHEGPLRRLAARAAHQMSEAEEGLYAELRTVASTSWANLHRDVTSQLTADVDLPDGTRRLPIGAVRGLANDTDGAVRRAAHDAEMEAWPRVAVPCAAAMNAIKGEAVIVNRRRRWDHPLDASLFANSVGRTTFEAMQSAVSSSLPDFRRWMRAKAALHGTAGGALPWWDLVAPCPAAPAAIEWEQGVDIVRQAFAEYSAPLGNLVTRALDERWIDAAPRDRKVGGAFCMPFIGARSLVLLNWSGSTDSAQTLAHELGHAYHNTTLAERSHLQRQLPMALAETASIFCETLVVESALQRLEGRQRLAMLDVDLAGSNQVVVDIHSRFLFETEVFARRAEHTLGVSELNELMLEAQATAYADGVDHSTAHPHMWVLKPHYYGSHFYNWPYTYGLLFGLGLFSRYREDPDRFRSGYETLLSRAGMDTAEDLGAAFGLDVTDESFWIASLDVIRARIAEYERLAAGIGPGDAVS